MVSLNKDNNINLLSLLRQMNVAAHSYCLDKSELSLFLCKICLFSLVRVSLSVFLKSDV